VSAVSPYPVPDGSDFSNELQINRSRFICMMRRCDSIAAAKAFVHELREQYPDASHHCYAYIAATPLDSQYYGFSDDGEPSGTAGKPMLMALLGSGLGEICAVVIRYFGGVKLGTGGLQRAYGGCVREALERLPTEIKVPQVILQLACSYHQQKDIEHLTRQAKGRVIHCDYGEKLVLKLSLPIVSRKSLQQQLTALSAGQLQLKEVIEK
jgi:uncharacterized YigZ family protein